MTANPASRRKPILFIDTVEPLPLADPTEAARFLKIKRHTLACYRNLDQGPAYYKFGRWIRYAWSDLRQWGSPGNAELVCSLPREEAAPDTLLLVDTPLAARFLTITPFCLTNYRLEGSGPSFHRYGRRFYYCLNDLRDWAENQRQAQQSSRAVNITRRACFNNQC